MAKVQDQSPTRSDAEQQWMDENLAEQSRRHQEIIAAMEALAPEREGWVNGFLERIQTLIYRVVSPTSASHRFVTALKLV